MSKDRDVSVGFGIMPAKNQGSTVIYQEHGIKKTKVFATVDEVIEILKKVSDAGYGEYVVVCNEYFLAKKGEVAEMNHEEKEASLGGYI